MENYSYNEVQIRSVLEDTAAEWQRLLQSFSEKSFNARPFSGSWTAAQVADHILLSNQSVTKALGLRGTLPDRDPVARVPELAGIFLDFSSRFVAADTIRPGRSHYEQSTLINSLERSFATILETMAQYELAGCVQHPAFGSITRLELLHFVYFHCRRHLRQLLRIYSITEHREYRLLSFLFQPPVLF
ncbi:DinB family protein [Taibaiella koreensis]|uniref:DinB family protein n=1 Tax=Taibaiella koreensis TaxID=1268548 RepID=UPI000E59944D|nr:DinB family protein [Taibaiella koreensis]